MVGLYVLHFLHRLPLRVDFIVSDIVQTARYSYPTLADGGWPKS